MSKQVTLPIVLTIAGSDSGGGAGIQADLKTFASLRVHGTTAITSLTAQNPKGVRGIQTAKPAMVRQQIEAVFDELRPVAVKVGMLYSVEIVKTVAAFFEKLGGERPSLVVDPVMVATSGRELLKQGAIRELKERLLPLATLVTPNVPEAGVLVGREPRTVEGLGAAARKIHERFGCAALVKGGHLAGVKEAVDIFYDGQTELVLRAPFIKDLSVRGTGCTYSAAITAFLAWGYELPEAVKQAKTFMTGAIGQRGLAGAYEVLNNAWR